MGPFSLTSCTHGWHFEIHSLQMNEKKCYTTVVPFQEGRCMAFQFSFDAELIPKIVYFQSICVSSYPRVVWICKFIPYLQQQQLNNKNIRNLLQLMITRMNAYATILRKYQQRAPIRNRESTPEMNFGHKFAQLNCSQYCDEIILDIQKNMNRSSAAQGSIHLGNLFVYIVIKSQRECHKSRCNSSMVRK